MSNLIKLKRLQGKPQLYKQQPITITDYEVDEEAMYLKVTSNGNKTEMLVPNADAETFFKSLLPMGESLITERQELSVYASQQKSLAELRNQLLELNTKLNGENGEKYIKQAKAINNNINTLLNSLKLELLVAKEIRKNQ